jgi:hypothetical protein
MSVEQAYLLAMGIIIFFAIAGTLFIEWNIRGKAKEK